VVCALVYGAFPAATPAGASTSVNAAPPTYPPAAWHAQLDADRALGESEAHALLGELQLPPGATPSPSEPAGDGGHLSEHGNADESRNGQSTAFAWFTAPGTTAQMIEYLNAHKPAGAWPAHLPSPLLSDSYEGADFPPSQGEIASKQLGMLVAQLPEGRVGVLAQAYVYWELPREQLPRPVRAIRIEVTGTRAGKQSAHTYVIARPAEIGRIVGLVETLLLERSFYLAKSCPLAAERTTVEFLRRIHGAPLATLTPGCGGVSLVVQGHEQPALVDRTDPSLFGTLEADLKVRLGY
jgi:hypothetical protein